MLSARYYREQAALLLSWARAIADEAYAARLRERAVKELEQAGRAPEVADLNPLLAEFNDQQMRKGTPP